MFPYVIVLLKQAHGKLFLALKAFFLLQATACFKQIK